MSMEYTEQPRCYKCSKDLNQVGSLSRANPKGVTPALWICPKCRGDKPAPQPDPDPSFDGMSVQESYEHQLRMWLLEKPLHNPVTNECCPDFSCCAGKIMPYPLRAKFVRASKENDQITMREIMGMGLSGLAASKGVNLHIVGENKRRDN